MRGGHLLALRCTQAGHDAGCLHSRAPYSRRQSRATACPAAPCSALHRARQHLMVARPAALDSAWRHVLASPPCSRLARCLPDCCACHTAHPAQSTATSAPPATQRTQVGYCVVVKRAVLQPVLPRNLPEARVHVQELDVPHQPGGGALGSQAGLLRRCCSTRQARRRGAAVGALPQRGLLQRGFVGAAQLGVVQELQERGGGCSNIRLETKAAVPPAESRQRAGGWRWQKETGSPHLIGLVVPHADIAVAIDVCQPRLHGVQLDAINFFGGRPNSRDVQELRRALPPAHSSPPGLLRRRGRRRASALLWRGLVLFLSPHCAFETDRGSAIAAITQVRCHRRCARSRHGAQRRHSPISRVFSPAVVAAAYMQLEDNVLMGR